MEIGKWLVVGLVFALVFWLEHVYRAWADEFESSLAVEVDEARSHETLWTAYAFNDECAAEI